jgi:putative redox protein
MRDAELLAPSIDPKNRKVSYRHLSARNDGHSKTVVKVRDTPEITIDEPTERSGTNKGATPVKTVLAGLCGCDAVITQMVA